MNAEADTSAEAQLPASWPTVERRWSALLSATPDLLFWLSADGRYLGSHAARPELLYAPPDTFVGRHLSEVLPPEVAELVLAAIDKALHDGGVQRVEYSLDLPIGTRYFEARIIATADEITAIVRDMTTEVEARRELVEQAVALHEQRALELELRAERDRADIAVREERAERVEVLARLTAGVAHDFNNLMGVILNYVHALERSELQELQRNDLGGAKEAAEAAVRLVRRLLASGLRDEPVGVCDLGLMVRAQVALLQPLFAPRVHLEVATPETAVMIRVDDDSVMQVVSNLVTNACDSLDALREVSLKTATSPVDSVLIRVEAVEGVARLVVTDDGIGMDDDTRRQSTQPFFTTKPLNGGTGLGLAIVSGIAEATHATLKIVSALNEGTTVTVVWPLADC